MKRVDKHAKGVKRAGAVSVMEPFELVFGAAPLSSLACWR
jgi:hypothetical protein